jgi:hypothetical protein
VLKESGNELAVVYVSSDVSEEDMLAELHTGWCAIKFNSESRTSLKKQVRRMGAMLPSTQPYGAVPYLRNAGDNSPWASVSRARYPRSRDIARGWHPRALRSRERHTPQAIRSVHDVDTVELSPCRANLNPSDCSDERTSQYPTHASGRH